MKSETLFRTRSRGNVSQRCEVEVELIDYLVSAIQRTIVPVGGVASEGSALASAPRWTRRELYD